MAFDWDEILVLKDPDNKEVSVNFKAVDGTPYPGSPNSELCVRIYSNETFTHITGSVHWVWLELSGVPDRYVKVRLDFDSGNGIEPPSSPQYAEFYPGDDRTLQFALAAGVASELLNSSNYRATATIEGTSCGVSIATVEFVKDVIPPEPQPETPEAGGDGEAIPGDNPECGPSDCGAYQIALFEGMALGTLAEMASLYDYQNVPLELGNVRFVTGYDTVNKTWPSEIGGYDFVDFRAGNAIVEYPCTNDIKVLKVPAAVSAYDCTSMSVAEAQALEHPGQPSDPFTSRATLTTKELSQSYRACIYAAEDTGSFLAFSGAVPYYVNGGNTGISSLANCSWDRTAKTITVNLNGVIKTMPYDGGSVIDVLVDAKITVSQVDLGGGFYDIATTEQVNIVNMVEGGGVVSVEKVGSFLSTFEYFEGNNSTNPFNMLTDSQVLAISSGIPSETVDDIIYNAKRTMQDYTPPTYCERIP